MKVRLIAGILLLLFTSAPAQKAPLLERIISVRLANLKTDAALNLIGEKGGFTFSYNPQVVDINRTVNYSFSNKSVREIIQVIFNGSIEGKSRGSHIILYKATPVAATPKKNDSFKITGYILSSDSSRIPWASVYNKKTMSSAVSDDYGYYKLELPADLTELSVNVSRKNYNDTVIQLHDNSNQFVNIILTPQINDSTPEINTDTLLNTAEETSHSFFPNNAEHINEENIRDTIYRNSQVSFLPFVGSNGGLSGITINDYSLNIFGGYSLGNRKLELAGFFNTNRGDVSGIQMAGFVNATGGNVKGLQSAGFVNGVKGNFDGCQLAGFVNVVNGTMDKCQVAGFINAVNNKVTGFQAAGFINAARNKMEGVQLAGFINTVLDTVKGVQVAGFINYAHKDVTGTQVSGFVNVAMNELTGSQVSTINVAKKVNGSQVGFFNLSDSCNGVPVGFISLVAKGYHKIEISADELFYVNVAFRTGVRQFHNIFTAGLRSLTPDYVTWNYGYGIGSSVPLSKKVLLDFDLTSAQIVKDATITKLDLLNKFSAGADFSISKNFSLTVAGTVNALIRRADYLFYPEVFDQVHPNIFYTSTFDGGRLQTQFWFGGKVGLRFL